MAAVTAATIGRISTHWTHAQRQRLLRSAPVTALIQVVVLIVCGEEPETQLLDITDCADLDPPSEERPFTHLHHTNSKSHQNKVICRFSTYWKESRAQEGA